MSDQDLVVETVRDILGAHEPFDLTPERPWDEGLWTALAGAGLTGVGLPESAGGSGGDLDDAVAIVRTLAAGAGAVPVAEQLLVAGPAVIAAGLPLPPVEEPLTFGSAENVVATPSGDAWTLSGTVADVPWSGVAAHAALLANGPDGAVLALLPTAGLTVLTAANLAGEPRGALVVDGVRALAAPLNAGQVRELRAGYALARAVQLTAALEQVLAWTVQYAGERQQFGRPLAKFQAIQMELAEMAGEVTAVTALTDAAVQALHHGSGDFWLAAAAAKVRAGAAVEVVARLAHQVHGAIGFTQEHRLHHLTKRLWSWRDEAGSELLWSRVLAQGLLADGPDGLWPALTRVV
ncbi:acyl-CoA dehydrogenase family protein [Blastococcus sp. CCUG 61487]|uniref:acyl-CoA dehydrogenase family protein n=1 Tax=Blastococcus sp. CCUG 61487 TaxID=1840703 RepID=UPI0010C0E66F|nr:acyl-CoA dehydrogenase family protein [Blastococcus sp. CCUG 61487]TKJ27872.1 acyl-CoA dehydrogenase [Blastococcus sp. CCUG 61487]